MFKHTKKIIASLFILAGITLFISCQDQAPVATNDAGQMNLPKVSTFIMPAGASFVSASLKIYAQNWEGDPHYIDIHSITADWNCPVTWNSFAGAFNPTLITTFNTAGGQELKTIDLSSTVEAWLGGGTNYGVLLKNQDETFGLAQWLSNESVQLTKRPFLEIVTTAGTFEVEPLYDTYISSRDGDFSFCEDTILYAGFVGLTPPGIKHTLIRFDIETTPQCWQDETAWAANAGPLTIRYVPRGNWATYIVYPNGDNVYDIYAGQTTLVGTATLTANGADSVDIAISLTAPWVLDADVTEGVKIQGYAGVPPASNPNPGGFTTYKGNDLTITVPLFNYYGIHLDVSKPIICPE